MKNMYSSQIQFLNQQQTKNKNMSKYKFQKQFLFKNHKLNQIQIFLENQPNLDFFKIRDHKLNTAIHHTSYNNQEKALKHYLDHKRTQLRKGGCNDIDYAIKKLIDQKNQLGFTALHYASYKGNLSIIELLSSYQASEQAVESSGYGLLHLAAQGNSLKTFLYFHKKKYNINLRDKQNSTPLHWAAYSGAQRVVEYLLLRSSIEINAVDNEGQTALHIATCYGHIKIVKKLLLAGARRDIRNHSQKIPLDIAKENQFTSLAGMLNRKYTCLDYLKFICNVKTKYEKRTKSKLPLFFIVLSALVVGLLYGIFYPLTPTSPVFICQTSFLLLSLILYISLLFRQSPTHQRRPLMYFSKCADISHLCIHCRKNRSQRQFHCDICQLCINQYDHHCKWINNCVGKHNLFRFILFILILELDLIWMLFSGISGVLLVCGIEYEWILVDVWDWVKQSGQGQAILLSASIVLILLGLSVGLPLLCLITVQIKNLLLNRTTYERFSRSTESILEKQPTKFYNNQVQNEISCRNCLTMCCEQEETNFRSQQTENSSEKMV